MVASTFLMTQSLTLKVLHFYTHRSQQEITDVISKGFYLISASKCSYLCILEDVRHNCE